MRRAPLQRPAVALAILMFVTALAGCGDDSGGRTGGVALERDVAAGPGDNAEVDPARASGRDQTWVRGRQPDLSILVVGNQRGKLKPCGCSEPQLGGLERLAAFLEAARHRSGGRLVALSMGWTLAETGESQAATKASLYRRALEVLGFDAMLGTSDLFVPAMAQPYEGGGTLARPAPPGNAPLSDQGPLALAARTSPLVEVAFEGLPLRALSLLDPAHLARLGGVARGVYPPDGVLGRLPPRPDALWIVSTDATGEGIAAVETAMRRLGPSVIVDFGGGAGADVLENVALDQGPFRVSLASLGKEVGLIDLTRDAQGDWRLSWHVVELYPDIGRADSALRDRVSELFEIYKAQVRSRGYLARFPTYPEDHRAHYVGSARCGTCHPGIYEAWGDTAHAHALETLEAKSYQWDPECVRCHVVGFQRLNDGRWARTNSGFKDPERTPYLAGVGCESCHGPGSAHVQDPRNPALWARGGPNVRHPGRRGCAVCHDVENSHAFPDQYADEYLPAVDHRRVPSDRRTVYADSER